MEGVTINAIYLVLAILLGTAISFIAVDPLIKYLKAKLIGQYIREDGPQEHLSKKGTPTMGGIAILASILLSSGFVLAITKQFNTTAWVVYVITIAFAALGFMDDYSKVMKKHNKGITGWTKLAFQFTLGAVICLFTFYILQKSSVSIFGITDLNIGFLLIPFGMVVIVGCSNAINLTDGLDGLASLTGAISFFTLSFFLYKTSQPELAVIAASVGGALVGFLFYNYNPAKIFMGDVGSLMLGGLFGILGVLGGLELWLIPIGIIFVIEVLSVIIQVISFKTTGKRVFKMTPIHHHFELIGNKETTVVLKFGGIQAVSCLVSIIFGYMWLFN